MWSKTVFKNPILVIGILMMGIFLMSLFKNKSLFGDRPYKLSPSSCKSVLVNLKKRIPDGIGLSCQEPIFSTIDNCKKLFLKNNPAISNQQLQDNPDLINQTWELNCSTQRFNHLSVTIETQRIKKLVGNQNQLKALLYRELVNYMAEIAQLAPEDNLERTSFVKMTIKHPKLEPSVYIEGKFLNKLRTLKGPQFIADHLSETAMVTEKKL